MPAKKRFTILLLTIIMMLVLTGCHSADSSNATKTNTEVSDISGISKAHKQISLVVNDHSIPAVLYDSTAAESLYELLPVTVTLDDSGSNFCGGTLFISYDEAEVHFGYKNGEIAYWPPADNLVIFKSVEETSEHTGGVVALGKVLDLSYLQELSGTIEIRMINND